MNKILFVFSIAVALCLSSSELFSSEQTYDETLPSLLVRKCLNDSSPEIEVCNQSNHYNASDPDRKKQCCDIWSTINCGLVIITVSTAENSKKWNIPFTFLNRTNATRQNYSLHKNGLYPRSLSYRWKTAQKIRTMVANVKLNKVKSRSKLLTENLMRK